MAAKDGRSKRDGAPENVALALAAAAAWRITDFTD
jgi:hypothetical protein